MEKISLSNALALLCNPKSTHKVEYRKASGEGIGDYGFKDGVTLHVTGGGHHFLNATKKLGADGQIKLWQPRENHTFDLIIDCITHIDGMVIDHPIK